MIVSNRVNKTENNTSPKRQFEDLSVLIFGAGGRQTLPMCKAFSKLGCRVTTYCSKKTDTGYLTRYSKFRVLYDPRNEYGEDYLRYGARLIKTGKFDMVVPMGDVSASFLSKNKSELKCYAKIAVNDWKIFNNVIDKVNTMKICEDNGIPAPKTMFSNNPVKEIREKELAYPVVVKPKTGVGSIGFNVIYSEDELIRLLDSYDNANGPLFVQEYIEQGSNPQFGGEFFRDRNGAIKASLVIKKPRWYPLDGGSTVLAVSAHDDEIRNSCTKLLDELDWNGCANFDLVWDIKTQQAKILEINGRPSAIVKLSFVCGIDFARLILENEFCESISDMNNYEDGKQISCLLTDLLWLFHSKTRFSSEPSWFNRRGIIDTVFSWDDPLPIFGYLISSVHSFRNSMKKRKRFQG